MASTGLIDLSRWQFATTAAFHMTFSRVVGRAGDLPGHLLCKFTARPAIRCTYRCTGSGARSFAIGLRASGIVAGIVLTFELGPELGRLCEERFGPILGPIICLEALGPRSFLEAGFIGILL